MSTIWPRYRLVRFAARVYDTPFNILLEPGQGKWAIDPKGTWGQMAWGFGPPIAELSGLLNLAYPNVFPGRTRGAYHYGRIIAGTPIDQVGLLAPLSPPEDPIQRGRGVFPDIFPRHRLQKFRVQVAYFGIPPFEELLSTNASPQRDVIHQPGSRGRWNHRLRDSFFAPLNFEALATVPVIPLQVVPEPGSRGRWAYHVQGGSFEPTLFSDLFGTHVWTEPGQTPIVTAWTEPAQSAITTSWTEPGQSPITSSWTEPAVTPITPSPEDY